MISLKVGDIVGFQQDSVFPPKYKFHVCVSVRDNDFWFFLINSENRPMYHCTDAIESKIYSCLKHDSFISCSRIFHETHEVSFKHLGFLTAEDMHKIINKTKTSRTLSPLDKQQIIHSITEQLNIRRH